MTRALSTLDGVIRKLSVLRSNLPYWCDVGTPPDIHATSMVRMIGLADVEDAIGALRRAREAIVDAQRVTNGGQT